MGNIPVWVLPNIWGLGGARDIEFGINISNKMLPNAAKCQGYSFYHFCIIKGKPERGVKISRPRPRLGLIWMCNGSENSMKMNWFYNMCQKPMCKANQLWFNILLEKDGSI